MNHPRGGEMKYKWLIPFSAEMAQRNTAHLVDPSVWVSRQLCSPRIVNTQLAREIGKKDRKCKRCAQLV